MPATAEMKGETIMNRRFLSMLRQHLVTAMLATLVAFGAEAKQIRLNLEPGQDVFLAGKSLTTYIRIGLEGIPLPDIERRAPINVALVLDRSGSMSGAKLSHAKEAAIMALDYLGRDDIISVVTYDHTVDVLVPATHLRDKQALVRAIQRIQAGGNTALFAGVSKGAAELRKFQERNLVNRVILLSDGLANVGPSTPGELQRLGRRLGARGVTVTTVGLGLGYNEDLMVRLANASDGNHVFAEHPSELAEVFHNEFGELGSVVAQGVTINIQCLSGVRPLRVLGRDAEIRGNRVTARLNQLNAEQEKYLVLEVDVPEGREGMERELVSVEVTYDDMATQRPARVKDIASIRYSASPTETKSSLNKEVMISTTEQLATELDDEALELKDKGDVAGARALFRQKAEYLEREAKKYDSDRLEEQSLRSRAAEAAVSAPEPAWNKARKSLREHQYIIRKQQSYR